MTPESEAEKELMEEFENMKIKTFLNGGFMVINAEPPHKWELEENAVKSFLLTAYRKGCERGREVTRNICTVGRNFPSRCYECGEKHGGGMSWEEAFKAGALFAKCFKCVSKEVSSAN